MSDDQWQEIDRVPDPFEAEILRGLLEAQGVQVWLAQEGAARALGLSLTPMGEVVLLVPASQASQALEILDQYDDGTLEEESTDIEYPANPED